MRTVLETHMLRMRSLLVRLVLVSVLLFSGVALTGCFDMSDGDYLTAIEELLAGLDGTESADAEEGEVDGVQLALTFPAGYSPQVFTTGWIFGARCVVQTEDGEVDLSDQVRWSGTGSFSPETGTRSRPTFNGAGGNEIKLSVMVDGKLVERTFSVEAVSPSGYAAVGDQAKCPADSHGGLGCAHETVGPITTGSPNVMIGGSPAARVGDVGVHASCCGPQTFEIVDSESSVLIDGRRAAKKGSITRHCGGMGTVISGAP